MRFGIHLPNSGVLTAHADLVAMAVNAESLGFDAVWVYDHLFNPVTLSAAAAQTNPDYYNKADMAYYDALTTLSVVAGATSTIRLGTRVLLPVLRSPIVVAKQIGTLDALAGSDRLILGVGAGWLVEEFDAVGIDRSDRFARLDEHVGVMRSIWTNGVTEHDGRFYRHAAAGFHPVPSSPVPILVGGASRGAIARVARWGDGWAMPNLDVGPDARTEYQELLDQLAAACAAEDRDPSTVRLVAGAPLSAPLEHFELLAELGIDDVDLMPVEINDLDGDAAARFAAEVVPQFN